MKEHKTPIICGAAKRVWVLRTVLFTIKELMKKHETIIGCEASVTDTQNWLLRNLGDREGLIEKISVQIRIF
jgi:hypothetical protein